MIPIPFNRKKDGQMTKFIDVQGWWDYDAREDRPSEPSIMVSINLDRVFLVEPVTSRKVDNVVASARRANPERYRLKQEAKTKITFIGDDYSSFYVNRPYESVRGMLK